MLPAPIISRVEPAVQVLSNAPSRTLISSPVIFSVSCALKSPRRCTCSVPRPCMFIAVGLAPVGGVKLASLYTWPIFPSRSKTPVPSMLIVPPIAVSMMEPNRRIGAPPTPEPTETDAPAATTAATRELSEALVSTTAVPELSITTLP